MKAKKTTLRERAEKWLANKNKNHRQIFTVREIYIAGYRACQRDNRAHLAAAKDVAGLRKFLKEIATEKICHKWCAIGCHSCRARTLLGKLTPERKQL